MNGVGTLASLGSTQRARRVGSKATALSSQNDDPKRDVSLPSRPLPSRALLLALQRTAGNRATATVAAAGREIVQRSDCGCAEDPCQKRGIEDGSIAEAPVEDAGVMGVPATVLHPGPMLTVQRARCHLVPAATCAAPVSGSAAVFSSGEAAAEAGPRARRAAMSPARQTASGHTGRARQLELFLQAGSPGLLSHVHGIFIDRDMSPGTAAFVDECANMVPPVRAPAGSVCVFVPARLNREALRFRQGRPRVGGQSREDWRVGTLQLLVHEIQHVVFDAARLGQPAGVSAATCSRSSVDFELSELAALASEFPVAFRAIPTAASASHPARRRLADWFSFAITNSGESIRGALTEIRCRCGCGEVDAFVRQTMNFVTSSWTPAERAAFNRELRRPAWGLHWPL